MYPILNFEGIKDYDGNQVLHGRDILLEEITIR